MEYRNFDLRIDPDGESTFRVRAQYDGREATTSFQHGLLEWADDHLAERSSQVHRHVVVGPRQEDAPLQPPHWDEWAERMGRRLYRYLLGGEVGTLFHRALEEGRGRDAVGLRIRLRMDPAERRLARLASLPWECLYSGELERFLCLDRRTPLVRCLDVRPGERSEPRVKPGKLRILLAMAEPRDLPALELDKEKGRIEEAFGSRPGIEVHCHLHTTREGLRERLLDGEYDALHFMGHGTYEPGEGMGCLAFEGDAGDADLVSAADLDVLVGDRSGLSLVVLNACVSSFGDLSNPLTSVAARLVRSGFPAVIGMALPIADRSAITFARRLYERYAAGDPLDTAFTESRIALAQHGPGIPGDWATPRLFLQGAPVFETRSEPAAPEPNPPEAGRLEVPLSSGERRSEARSNDFGTGNQITYVENLGWMTNHQQFSPPGATTSRPEEDERD